MKTLLGKPIGEVWIESPFNLIRMIMLPASKRAAHDLFFRLTDSMIVRFESLKSRIRGYQYDEVR